MATEILIKGIPSRVLPQGQTDFQREGIPVRLDRYGSLYVQGEILKIHPLADEGSYFLTNNGQIGITTALVTAFAALTPTMIIVNNDSPSNPAAKRLYLDYIELLVTVAGVATAATATFAAVLTDQGNRFSSGGTNLSSNIVSPNQDNALRSSIGQVYFGGLTATAAQLPRTIVGQRMVRPAVSATATNVLQDVVRMEFGSTDTLPSIATGSTGALQANIFQSSLKLPPVIIGPGQSILVYVWAPTAATTATSYLPEIGWWER